MKAAAVLVALEHPMGFVARAVGSEVRVREFPWNTRQEGQADPVSAIQEALSALGAGPDATLCLGVPSSQVMAAPVAMDDLPRKGRRSVLVYRLEEHLPMDAEELTVDFLPAVGGRALGVAVETAVLRDIVGRLEAAGAEIETICPTAILALRQLVSDSREAPDFFVLGFTDHGDVFRMVDGRPVSWHVTSLETVDILRAIHVDLLARPAGAEHPTAVVAGVLAEDQVKAIADDTGLACTRTDEASCLSLAARAAAGGEDTGRVNMRRDALAPANRLRRLQRPLRATLALVFLLMAVVTGGAWLRAARYDAEMSDLVDRQRAIFARLYPNASTPPAVRKWLQSESLRLAGVSGAAGAMPEQPSALETLRRAASGFPKDLRFRILDLRVEPGEVFLDGQARSHADAESVARGIAQQGGFAMESPRTENLVKGGVAFTLVGKPGAPSGAATASKATTGPAGPMPQPKGGEL